MALRLNPLTALEGSFRGFPFLIARERKPGGQRGPWHEYPDRDVPYFEALGRKGKQFELTIYFIGVPGDTSGATADIQADGFEALLTQGQPGPLILPGLQRETVYARSWDRERSADKAGWVQFEVTFVEAGRNQYPASQTAWPQTLVAAALSARNALSGTLGVALSLVGLPIEASDLLGSSAGTLVAVLGTAAVLVGGVTPSSALTVAAALGAGYLAEVIPTAGIAFDTVLFATSTAALLAGWADALAGDNPTTSSLTNAVTALFTVYDSAASDAWYAATAVTPVQAVELANQTAVSAAVRRICLTEAARLAASIQFASYDDAAALRAKFAAAFDDEISVAASADGTREVLATLQAVTLNAISAAGADKAKLVPYVVPMPRTAIGLAQLFYPDDDNVAARAAEIAARNGVIHPSFMPVEGERLSS